MVPQSSFKIKESYGNKKISDVAYSIIAFLIGVLYLFFFDKWEGFVSLFKKSFWFYNLIELTINPFFVLMVLVFVVFLFGLFVYNIAQLQINKKLIKHLDIHGNSIELFEDKNDSFFDKYLDEILYIFDNVDVDVVVFEDIDRFGKAQIFTRLREINALVNAHYKNNNTEKEETNKVLRFFYLMRDDIFESKDRTKFFDYIIPVIPVVDSSNSYDILKRCLEQNRIIDKFSDKFLREISLYVDDMRLLKNICNEFIIYNSLLNDIALLMKF